MENIPEEQKERFLLNLRLVNERAQVEPEVVDLLEACARIELGLGRPVNLTPSEPHHLSQRVRELLWKNRHLPPQAQNFLATYCQQIHDQGIIFLLSPAHLAQTLSLSPEELSRLSKTANRRYSSYQIPKSDGSARTIHAPNPELKTTQRAILDNLFAFIPLNPHAEGFRRNRSIVTNSQRHVGQKVVVKLDLKDFFPSITSDRIFGLFLALGYPRQVASLLTNLTTYQGALPTGAPTSPALSNLVCRRLDRRLSGAARKMEFEYSRYADDITFSSQNPQMVRLLPFFQGILKEERFEVKYPKTRILRSGGQQKVTGIVVNSKTNIARQDVRTLRAILHNCRTGDLRMQASKYAKTVKGLSNPEVYPLSRFQASLRGKINHIRRVNPEMGEKLLKSYLSISFPA